MRIPGGGNNFFIDISEQVPTEKDEPGSFLPVTIEAQQESPVAGRDECSLAALHRIEKTGAPEQEVSLDQEGTGGDVPSKSPPNEDLESTTDRPGTNIYSSDEEQVQRLECQPDNREYAYTGSFQNGCLSPYRGAVFGWISKFCR